MPCRTPLRDYRGFRGEKTDGKVLNALSVWLVTVKKQRGDVEAGLGGY